MSRPSHVILLGLAALAACAPRLAPPGPGPAGAPATRPGLAEERLVTADGLALPLRRWLPEGRPRAVILALHGFNDYSRAFEMPGSYWAEKGIATYAYDQRGFGAAPHRGLWPGTDALVADARTAVAALRARHPGSPLYLLGDSMGGAVAMAAATGDAALAVDGLILAAPAVWGRAAMPALQRGLLWLAAHTVPWMEVTGRGLDIQASDNLEVLRQLARDELVIKSTRIDAIYGLVDLMDRALAAGPRLEVPALLLYGESDEVIPIAPTLRLWRSLRDTTRQRPALYPTGWHMLLRDLGAETIWDDIVAWIDDPMARLPSGADRRARQAIVAD